MITSKLQVSEHSYWPQSQQGKYAFESQIELDDNQYSTSDCIV